MQLNTTYQNPTLATLEITASSEELNSIKNKVLKSLSSEIKVPGFRAGHVPSEVVEKNIDSNRL
jgi:FKBP-type peptidyl-prolyl cis-trans isomerase (trigger factor)